MNLETVKFPNWQKIDPIEFTEPHMISVFNERNYIDLDTRNTWQTHGMISIGYMDYVPNYCFLFKIGRDCIPGYYELYDIERRSYLSDPKVTVLLRDVAVWFLGTEGLLKEYLPRVMASPLPEILVPPDSELAQQCLFNILAVQVFYDQHGPYGNPAGHRNCTRKVQLRKPTGDFEVLAELHNPFAKVYESEEWQFSKSYAEKKEGDVHSLNWMNNRYDPRQYLMPSRKANVICNRART